MDVEMKVNERETAIKHLLSELIRASTKCQQIEQCSRNNCKRIFGLIEKRGENTKLNTLICEEGKRIKVDLQEQDIDGSHRVGDPS